ncbi:MAG: ribokinase [Rhizobiales bacterium]|nr:ribokinase [Hyphomicrobiales bacterium]
MAMNDAASIFVLGSFVAACSAKVAHLPRPGESLRAEAFTLEAGGKGLNLAMGARRLGASVDGLLAVGNDLLAQLAEPALLRAGLPLSMLRRYDGATGSGIGFTDAKGENCLAVYPGANLRLSAADVRAARHALGRAKLVLAQFEVGDEPIAEAFALARAGGAATLLNPSPYRAVDANILAHTSILVVNRVEAEQMATTFGASEAGDTKPTGADSLAAFGTHLLDCGPEAVSITLGADGALLCRRNAAPLHQPAFAVETVDTLGAGDAFSAGIAVSLIEDRSWDECLRRAAACGALATRRLGVFEALPMREELEQFLKSSF